MAAVLDSSDDAIFAIDGTGVVTRWNAGARDLFGYDEAEVVGGPVAVLFADHRRGEGKVLVHRALSGERVDRADSDISRTDGLVVPVSLTITPISAPQGRSVAVAVARDVSEQKLAAATLTESEERLWESEALAHTGAWLWDGQDLVQWSDGMYSIHGIDPLDFDETLEAHFAVVQNEDRGAAKREMLEAFAQPRSFETEYRIQRPDHTSAWVHVRGEPILDALHRPQGMTGIYQDVSERRRAEADRRLLSEAHLRQRQAREINDEIVQRLVVAQLALDLGDSERARIHLQSTLATARHLVTELLGAGPVQPGSLRRSAAAESI
ncbi:MAG: PAS domain S-box protein [Acidimicrobiia bacterium]|nr:PAS domain S-box protein [Acidimicrobiia bacterium]